MTKEGSSDSDDSSSGEEESGSGSEDEGSDIQFPKANAQELHQHIMRDINAL